MQNEHDWQACKLLSDRSEHSIGVHW